MTVGPRDGRPPLPPEVLGASLQPLQRSGRIVALLYAPRGEIRGAVLEDGSQFRLRKGAAVSVQPLLQVGNRVEVKGYGTANAFGACLEPTELSVNGAPAMNLYGVR
jgi:hypothetical protein